LGRFVGIAENVGRFMTFKILTDNTKKIFFRSNVRSALDPKARHLRLDPISGETSIPAIIKSRHESDSSDNKEYQCTPMPVFHPSDLVGKTFLMDPMEDGQPLRARIVRAIEAHDGEIEDNPTRIQFLCSINDDESEEIITYNEILNHIENDETEETTIWKFKRITAHEGPLTRTHPSWKGSPYNLLLLLLMILLPALFTPKKMAS
jgi:hypothetical protein